MKKIYVIVLIAVCLGFVLGWLTGPMIEHVNGSDFFNDEAGVRPTVDLAHHEIEFARNAP